MNKLNKVFCFNISKLEKDSIEVLKEHNVNVSRFLRQELRRFSDQLRSQNEKNQNKLKGGIRT
jgi:lipid II:glycine glycyltransferase (peptidoglycan interpeptide bridge formation enzyme)